MSSATWVLLDRDGTINQAAREGEYITKPEQLRLLPRAGDAIARLNTAELRVAVVTNQRGVALGLITERELEAINTRLSEMLVCAGADLDVILCCVHHRGSCDCRKPQPGLLRQAARILELPLARAVMVGDSESDIEAGIRAGTRTIRLGDSSTASAASVVVPSLWAATDAILAGVPG